MIKVTKRHHDAALKFVNECRAKIGLRPVKRLRKGDRSRAASCTIARTIIQGKGLAIVGPTLYEHGVDASFGLLRGKERTLHSKQSKLVHDFIVAFDEGEIPELVR